MLFVVAVQLLSCVQLFCYPIDCSLLIITIYSPEKCLFKSFAHFQIRLSFIIDL